MNAADSGAIPFSSAMNRWLRRASTSHSTSRSASSWNPASLPAAPAEDLYSDGDHVATYRFVDYGGLVELGWNLSRTMQLRLGYIATERRADVQTGIEQLPEADLLDAGFTASLKYDSRDAGTFATSGIAAAIEYLRMDESLGSDRDWERIEAGFRTCHTGRQEPGLDQPCRRQGTRRRIAG